MVDLYLGIEVFVNTTKNLNPSAAVKMDLHRIHEVNKLVTTKKACSKEKKRQQKGLKNRNKSGSLFRVYKKRRTVTNNQTVKQNCTKQVPQQSSAIHVHFHKQIEHLRLRLLAHGLQLGDDLGADGVGQLLRALCLLQHLKDGVAIHSMQRTHQHRALDDVHQ
jgi:hypothetical protein